MKSDQLKLLYKNMIHYRFINPILLYQYHPYLMLQCDFYLWYEFTSDSTKLKLNKIFVVKSCTPDVRAT